MKTLFVAVCLVVGLVASNPAEARAAIQALAAQGIKHTGEIGLTPEPAPPQSEIEVLKAIVDQTISYSTDQNAADLVVLEHELKSYSIVFSMADIHRIIGLNAARYVGLADQIGTLEAGKLAVIILIDGNPTLNIYEMLKTKVVLKEGKVVVDKR